MICKTLIMKRLGLPVATDFGDWCIKTCCVAERADGGLLLMHKASESQWTQASCGRIDRNISSNQQSDSKLL